MTDDSRPAPPPATYPGEPGSRADVGRRRFIEDDEWAYRERLHPEPNANELAYRARLLAERDRT